MSAEERSYVMNDTERERVGQSDEVAAVVFDHVKKVWPDLHPVLDLRYGVADALWDAGYRKTGVRVLTTENEVNALPFGSIVRDNVGDAYIKGTQNRWLIAGERASSPTPSMRFPATVLYVDHDWEE